MPIDLIILIAEATNDAIDSLAMCLTSKRLRSCLLPEIFKVDVKSSDPRAFNYASYHNNATVARKAIAAAPRH